MALYMIELRPDPVRLLTFLKGQDLLHDQQLGYGIHAWLKAAFGELAPRPWRLLWDGKRPARILGYARCDAGELKRRVKELAEPAAASVCPGEAMAGKEMPTFACGRRLAFEVLTCPVGRNAKDGKEKDFFLLTADRLAKDEPLERNLVYCDWAKARLERSGSVRIIHLSVAGFRLVRQLRQTQSHPRRRTTLIRPEVLFRGEWQVADPQSFANLLARGIGRHRAFGYGMILLRPPS